DIAGIQIPVTALIIGTRTIVIINIKNDATKIVVFQCLLYLRFFYDFHTSYIVPTSGVLEW
ncbi:MAG TPA: hypothetical protein VJU13_09925, partial [Candidatus Nitrosocosmicus sp.]|nr:hypothetical protein [Candidatus Nitrosocosmicus sp.]